MARGIDQGLTFDPYTGEFAVWQAFPKALKRDVNIELYSGRLPNKVRLKTVIVKSGRKMLKLEGTFQGPSYKARELLINLRSDLTQYVKKIVAQQGD